ncbi:MAG: hypothetical protein QM703_12110 [Gemmatales bacterium]
MTTTSSSWWRYLRGLTPAVILLAIVLGIIIYAVDSRLRDELEFEENILKEWVLETRVGQSTLPELVKQYLKETGADKESKPRCCAYPHDGARRPDPYQPGPAPVVSLRLPNGAALLAQHSSRLVLEFECPLAPGHSASIFRDGRRRGGN